MLLINIPLTPNQLTLIMLLLAPVRLLLLATGDPVNILVAAFLLFAGLLLDRVDGNLARHRKMTSLRGPFLDKVYNDFHFSTLFLGTGIGLFITSQSLLFLGLGITAAFFTVLTRNAYGHRKYILYTHSKNPKAKMKQKTFTHKGILGKVKESLSLLPIYHDFIFMGLAVVNLFYPIFGYYLWVYAVYYVLVYPVLVFYLSIFKEDKR